MGHPLAPQWAASCKRSMGRASRVRAWRRAMLASGVGRAGMEGTCSPSGTSTIASITSITDPRAWESTQQTPTRKSGCNTTLQRRRLPRPGGGAKRRRRRRRVPWRGAPVRSAPRATALGLRTGLRATATSPASAPLSLARGVTLWWVPVPPSETPPGGLRCSTRARTRNRAALRCCWTRFRGTSRRGRRRRSRTARATRPCTQLLRAAAVTRWPCFSPEAQVSERGTERCVPRQRGAVFC